MRSRLWYGVSDLRSFNHRSRELQMGYSYEDFMGKPVVAIVPIEEYRRLRHLATPLRDRVRSWAKTQAKLTRVEEWE